jgi:hypothetical protein
MEQQGAAAVADTPGFCRDSLGLGAILEGAALLPELMVSQ